jgi:hypothetical protein
LALHKLKQLVDQKKGFYKRGDEFIGWHIHSHIALNEWYKKFPISDLFRRFVMFSSLLAKFSKCLGLSMKGREEWQFTQPCRASCCTRAKDLKRNAFVGSNI